jgi:hypothetical protein
VGGIKVTNAREIKKDAAPAELAAIFQANPAKSVQAIPDIYGVNVGLWAPELIEAASLSVQKSMALGVVRYPGGLRSDEEDWKKTLEKKDFHVDTDEFLDWCAASRACKPMFTANVGDGTPAMAAEVGEVREQDPHQGAQGPALGDRQRGLRQLAQVLRQVGQGRRRRLRQGRARITSRP